MHHACPETIEAEGLLNQLAIYGTPDEIAEQFDFWYDAGVTRPTVFLNANLEQTQIDLILRAAMGEA